MPLPMVPAPMTPTFLILLMGSSQDEREVVIMRVRPARTSSATAARPRRQASRGVALRRRPSRPNPELTMPSVHAFPNALPQRGLFAVAGLALLVAACGPRRRAAFQGFPPAAGDDARRAAEDASGQLRICRADRRARRKSRCARASPAFSRSAVPGRRGGEGRADAVRHRSEAAARRRRPPPKPRSPRAARRSRRPSARWRG